MYQQFAREIGEVREKEYLTRIQYGNADPSGGVDRFWLDGALRISAMEQVDFLKTVSKRASVQGRASASGQGYHDRRGRARLDPEGKDRMAGACRTADRLVGRLGRDADRGGHLRAEHRSAGRHEGCAETEAIVRSILQSIGALPR